MAMRVWWMGLVACCVLAACGGGTNAPEATPTSTDPAGGTSAAGDPSVSTTAALAARIRIAPWDHLVVATLCVDSTESYSESIVVLEEGEPQPLQVVVAEGLAPIKDAIVAGIADFGLPVVMSGCDATLTVAVDGEVMLGDYLGVGSLYAGADLSGVLTLTGEGGLSLSAAFEGRSDPPATYVVPAGAEAPLRPEDAPFVETVEDDLCRILRAWIDPPFDLQPDVDCWIAG
jgi:hypothetical protein